ncbi:centromere protein F isoform X1 [Acinonyx jubatus]|uniref:Centromere protein F isoform X1 n=1 Tax=Acinonyx jubatus TaxID=32536 RepID=A0A6J2APC9_ACIJB|nr:centromere protein F isoform X1 [Acinonyx jubatus]XP_026930245.2 centromere protein F isoform X1 [Acinonyx jubatus]XP_053064785.1 centromere protein F isoform X1 [Acinonyx jubatus]
MSWALEEWKEGLPTRALQKIQELEGQLDKLKKERQQRQFQLETLEAALQKQKQKVEHEKTEGANLKRENQSLMEVCENLEKTKQKISHELQVKESQVNFQEGQLNSSKKQIEKLEQELKRCKSELERSHQAAQSADASLHPCTTPQKIFATPLTPSQHYSGSKYEDLKEKYNKEVEERKRLEAEVKALQAKKVSQAIPQSTMNHRDIARHQTSSSVFSWQQEKTPSRLPSGALKTPIRRDFSASPFFGEQEMTPSRSTLQTGKRDASNSFCDNSSNSHLLDQLKAQNQELRSKISDLELRLQGQEKETKGHASKCQELQLQLEKAKVELMEKEKVLNKNRDELVRMTAQYDQASTKCAALEQKLRRLSEDLSCQRQNADSARCSLEQKIKEKEKEFQEELGRQQRACQALDQECTQMKARLTQELQQAKNTHNILQADLDKVTSVKHQLEKNLEEFKQKFCRTEQALQASQMQENELRRSSEEAKKENSLLKSQSEQRAREACHLEEELRKAKQSLSQSQNFAEEMRAKNASQETMLRDLQEKINQQENSLTLEKLKLALADLEKQRDCSQDLLKKREHHIEQLNDKLSKMEKESEALLIALELKKKEYEELKEEETLFARWKSEKEQLLSQLESEKGSLQSKLHHLETCLKTQQIKSHEYNEKVRTLEMESENLNVEIRNLHNVIDSKTVEVETHKQAYVELQQKAKLSDQKHKKEVENMCLKISQLTRQVEDLEHKLQLVSSEVTDRDQRYQDLRAEYESLRDLLKSKDASLVTNEAHQGSLLAFEQQSAMNNSFANILGEQRSTPSGRSKCQLEADHSPKSSASLQNRVISLEFSLESQKQMNSDLQKQCEELVQIRGEIEDNLIKAEQMHQSFVAETSQRISKLQEDTSVHQNVFAETLVALENKEREFQLLNEKLETEQAEIQELKKSNHLLQESLKELQLLSESLSSEKKEMSAAISLNRKEIEELTQENETLKEINATLSQEKINLLQKSESFLNCIDERDKSISELSNQYQQERLILLQRCEETGRALEDLSEKYKAAQEKNSELECLLSECTSACENREHELEHLKEAFAREHQAFVTKLALAEERNQNLILELGAVQQDLRLEIVDIQNNSKSEADGLKQEIMTLKEEQSKMQKELNALLQEKEHLLTLTEMKQEHQILESEPISDSMKGESDINECHVQLPMDLQVEHPPLDCYNAQLVQSGAKMRRREFKLQESEKEKECLQTIRVELDTGNVQRDTQSQELSGPEDCVVDTEGKYVSGLHEFSSQNDNAHLQCSLQTAMSKLSELEKMCETLQVEKLELISELKDSRSECITAASKMAEEVEKLVNEVKILNDEHGLLQGELVKETAEGELGEQQNEQKCASLNPLNDSNCYEHLTLSNKEVQMHFAELQEKLSSLQSEHKILHDQHCQMSSKMSDLQSYVDTLKAENSVLSTSLRNFQGDLVKEEMPGPQEGHFLSLSFSRMTDSPGLTSLGESSFCKDLLDQTGETSLLNNLVGNLSANQCNVEEGSCCSLEEENLTKKEILSTPVKSVEELEILCQMYLQSLKKLEDKIESQEMMKNKEIEELEQLLSSERKELDCLKKQYLSENEQWQQKLTSVTVEMESKLAAEKKQTEHLSLELEVARLQLQGLDLSSRSLLCTDIEDLQALRGGNDSCDIKESEECTLETKESTPKLDIHKMCENGVQQDLSLEMEKVAETGAAQFTGEWSREQSTETSYETPVEDKTPGCSERISQLSSSDPNALVPMDFLENQVSIQNLQLQVRETSNENLRLLHVVEQRDKKVESLLNEIKELDSKLDLQEAQLTTKTEACIELEKIVEELKKEKSNLSKRLRSFSCDNQELHQRAESLEVLSSNLDVGTDKFSHEVIEDNVAKVNNWRERFLDVENELKRIESEKGSIKHHALSVEAALETVQTEKLYLEQDSENKQKVIARLEEELSVVTSERNQLRGELDTLSKENKELDLMSEKMKQKIQELESHQGECLQPPDVAGAEVKDQTQVLQTLPSNVSELLVENARLQEQLQSLEKDSQALSLVKSELEIQIEQLNEEKESLVRESESLQTRLNESEHEKLAVAKSLENALMEKGEVAVRLSSTQEEVHQLRKGIEKLRVRIEADEKKQLHVLEKLRASERKTDSLQDKVENLERELQMSEENQELVILDAENSKAEVETLKAQMELMAKSLKDLEVDLVTVRFEKENLMKQLQEEQGQLSELDALLSSCKGLLEEKEKEKIQVKEESTAAMEMLQTQLKELNEEVTVLCNDQEIQKVKEQSLDSSAQEIHRLRNSIEKLKVCLEANKKEQLQVLGKLKESAHYTDLLKSRVESLERELEASGQDQERVSLEAENSKAEVEALKAKIEEMAQNLRDLELDLVHMRSEKENVTKELQKEQGRVSELEILNSSFENLLQEKEQEKVQMREDSKIVVETLQTQLKELTEKLAALCCDQDTWKAQEQNLSRQIDALEHEKAQLLQGLDEVKSSYVSLQSSANGLIQQVGDGKRKLEKKDEEISNLKNQIQDREQLISKLSQVEGEQQLWKKQKGELEDMMVGLEQKVQMLQSKNDTLQDTLETLQHSYKALEKELELTKMENVSFVEKVNTMTGKETELQREMHEMAQKTAELKEEFIGEKNRLTRELTVMSEEIKSSQGQLRELMLENSELKKNLDCAHKDQMEKEEKTREEIAEYQLRLQEAEKKHQALLLDTNKQYETEIQTYREKLTSSEECLCSQKAEMELLKSSKEELNNSLKAATQMLEELKKTKADSVKYTDQLKKENERSQGKIKLLIKSCKQLEEEKEMLQNELSHLEGTQEKQKTGAVVDSNVEELMAEIKELKETLEEKSQEADEYLDKYCSLLISHEKLEKAKEMLETQVARLCSQSKLNLQSSPLLNAVVPESSPAPSATEKKLSSSQNKAPGKRQRSIGIPEDGGGAAPSTPETFSKKSRKARRSGIHPSEDAKHTEFEPEGLPEVVKKGFADIPTGKTSPYVLRRTTMPTRTSPRLAAQKLTPSPLSLNKENHTETSKPTAGGSRSQKVKVAQQSPVDSGSTFREPTTRSLSVSNLPERSSADSPREGLRAKRGRLAPSPEAIPESKSSENCRVQ